MTAEILHVHCTTLLYLDPIEKVILDELIRLGRAVIISDIEIEGMPNRRRGPNEGKWPTPGRAGRKRIGYD